MTDPAAPDRGGTGSVGRRSYLKVVGTAIGTATLAPTAGSLARVAVEHRGYQFDAVVNLVDDYGADPTGSAPADDAIVAATNPNTLVMVPDGKYRFTRELVLTPTGPTLTQYAKQVPPYWNTFGTWRTLGFLAEDGANPLFIPPRGHNNNLIWFDNFEELLFEGIDIDIRASETTAGLRFDIEDRFHIQDVEFIGRGTHPDSDVTNALNLTLTNESGVGIVRNVVATQGSGIGEYKRGNGRTGAYVGRGTDGSVRFEDCRFEEFGNNGLYVGRTPGRVQVVGGLYRNNNISQIRLAGKGSYVRGARIEVDLGRYTGPLPDNTAHNTRGIVIDSGSIRKAPGAEVRNCDIVFEEVENSTGAVCVVDWAETNPQELYLQDSTIEVNADFWAIYSEGGPVHATDVSITGAASGSTAIYLRGTLANDSTFQNTCIHQTGVDQSGLRVNGAHCSIGYSNVNVPGKAWVEQNGGSVVASNITFDETCTNGEETGADVRPETRDLTGKGRGPDPDEW